MKLSDKELRRMADRDGWPLTELLQRRREVRRLRRALLVVRLDCVEGSVWARMIDAALKPQRGGK